jgi:arylsulfatase A-like enzyme
MRWLLSLFATVVPVVAFAADPPNVLIVMTDDQGFGDLGVHGNPVIRTPKLDAFAKQSVWLKNFYVSPVCSPTRSSLLSGQYNYRTGVVDTYLGRSMMRPDVRTLPEHLAAAGYRTGIFGKWHLGDNYPLRPEDRGFQETLWSRGGGLAQPSDSPLMEWKTAYFDPILNQNGKEVKTKGYCTDVFTDAAVKFIGADRKKPFFAYVAFNAPHGPLQVPDELAATYRKLDLSEKAFPKLGQPWPGKADPEGTARLYGMVENIDTNFGRMLKALDDAKVADNTIVIFLTDNGPDSGRFNGGLRGRKASVYEGGIRVPCYVRWGEKLKPHTVETPLIHIDVTPTILESCSVDGKGFDGRSFAGLLRGDQAKWSERTLFWQWHRGDEPEKYRAFAARNSQYKLVQAGGGGFGTKWKPKYELFDIKNDPFEEKDLAAEKPEVVADLKKQYEAWFDDVTKKGFVPPRIIVGNEKENPVRLSRQDWRGPKASWSADGLGHWEIDFQKPGRYKLTARSRNDFDAWEYDLSPEQGVTGEKVTAAATLKERTKMQDAVLTTPAQKGRVEVRLKLDGKTRGPEYLELEYLGPIEKK